MPTRSLVRWAVPLLAVFALTSCASTDHVADTSLRAAQAKSSPSTLVGRGANYLSEKKSAAAKTAASAIPKANALATLATLEVKGRAPKTGYSRAAFGQAWKDVDRNGCDTRNDMLRRDLSGTDVKPGTKNCKVLSGYLADPYTGDTLVFTAGKQTGSAVQVDHVVALSDAWQTGAQNLSAAEREKLANDPLELLAVSGTANTQKKDGDAATWLPPQTAYRCTYVARQIAVKARYHLWVTQAEHDAMAGILANCSGQSLPAGAAGAQAPAKTEAPAAPAPAASQPAAKRAVPKPAPAAPKPAQSQPAKPAQPAAPAQPAQPAQVYYAKCDDVKAAGRAPLHRGDPGYRAGLDRDGDGIACEK